jgi:hypothetical protein
MSVSLVLYFNELSLAGGGAAGVDARTDAQWLVAVDNLGEAFDATVSLRSECRFFLPPLAWCTDCGGKSLGERLRLGMQKDRYLRVLQRVGHLTPEDVHLVREVCIQGAQSVGATCADLAAGNWGHGWVMSLAHRESPWYVHTLVAHRSELNDVGDLLGPTECTIANIAASEHVDHWRGLLLDWGRVVAESSFLDELDGHPIVMYSAPLEHGPPHVHLLESRNTPRTLAKFRIDVFERPKGPPTWDSKMQKWVEAHRTELLRSWARCQAGGHPYQLEAL